MYVDGITDAVVGMLCLVLVFTFQKCRAQKKVTRMI